MLLKRAVSTFALVSLLASPVMVLAQSGGDESTVDSLKEEVDELSDEVKAREKRIKEIDSLAGRFRSRINEQEQAQSTLENTVALLENRIQEKQLAVERAQQQIELTSLEIDRLGQQIATEQTKIEKRQSSLAELLRQIHEAEQVSVVDVLVTRPSLSEYFANVEELRRLQDDLSDATKSVKTLKTTLETKKTEQLARQGLLTEQKGALEKEKLNLEGERSAKMSLLAESLNTEEEFRKILYELRQEQQSTTDDVLGLQERLKEKLNSVDQALARGDVLLSWPVPAKRGISAHFHDHTYPFRNLFEHPGTDIPVPVGTPVKAAAGGYIAYTRTGKQYGNYIMVIHPGNVATVYAHLSRFNVDADQYVERGDVIGYSGGRPGDQGAGLSTGPHLHFEVRLNGIPTDPEPFLPSL